MAPRKKVPTLQDISLQATQKLITVITQYVVDDERVSLKTLSTDIGVLLSGSTPPSLHDRIAKDLLQTLEKMLKDYSTQAPRLLPKCAKVVQQLVAVLPSLQVVELSIFDHQWSEVVYSSLLLLLDRMPRLKVLSVSTEVDDFEYSPLAQKLTDGCHLLSNLTSFTLPGNCTDQLIAALCKNCKAIREIQVSMSNFVSDDSVPSLSGSKMLQVVNLEGTSVTPQGYFDLLTTSKSNLLDVGKIQYPIEEILDLLEVYLRPFRTFPLQLLELEGREGLNSEQFGLVVKYFPNLKNLALDGDCPLFDPSCISKLKNLSQLSFCNIKDETNKLCRFLSARGPFITSLTFQFCFEMKGKSFIDIAMSCPNIETLRFFNALSDEGPDYLNTRFPTKPFQKLREFKCDLNISLAYLKFVLCNASYIQDIDLKTKEIADEFFESVFQANPLKALKSLKIKAERNKISARMLEYIIISCDEISSLIYLGTRTLVSKRDLKRLRAYIVANNYDLNLTNIDPVKERLALILASL